MRKGFRQLVDEAKSRIRSLTLEEARARHGRADVVFVDLRDVRELEREGLIQGAFHCPRGMLEFWIDPESPYFKDVFGSRGRSASFTAMPRRGGPRSRPTPPADGPRARHGAGGRLHRVEGRRTPRGGASRQEACLTPGSPAAAPGLATGAPASARRGTRDCARR